MTTVHKFMFLCVIALISLNTIAQNTPQGIYYQAVARGDSGDELANENLSVRIDILEESILVYSEFHSPTTDQFGLFELVIGTGTVEEGEFSTINWGAADHFLTVALDSGDGFEEVSTTQFLTVPYSFYSARAATADDVNDADADPSNETIQNFGISGDNLELQEAGQIFSVPLAQLADDGDWELNSGNQTLTNTGLSVGVNTTTPSSTLEVNGSLGVNVSVVESDPNITVETTLGENNHVVLCDVVSGPIIVNLPDAVNATGRMYTIKRYDSSSTTFGFNAFNQLTISPTAGQTIDNQTQLNVGGNTWSQLTLISDGSNWFITSFSTNPN